MKKLMIALAVVAMATVSQAVQWKWSVSSSDMMMEPGSSSAMLSSGNAYLFAGLTSSQLSSIVADFAAGTLALSGAEQTSTVKAGGVLNSTVSFDDTRASGTVVDWVMVITSNIGGDDYLFISDVNSVARGADGKSKSVTFKEYALSSAAAKDAASGYAGAGWYSAASTPVPEPTSGLLMLLGVAGLALRRRRA